MEMESYIAEKEPRYEDQFLIIIMIMIQSFKMPMIGDSDSISVR